MTAIVFPSTVPGPSVSTVTSVERRLLSDLTGGPQQARGVQRDYLGTQSVEWSLLDPTAAAALDAWWTTDLTFGGAWFASIWPSPQGWVSIVRRFMGVPKWTHLGGGFWRVTAQVLVRGRGMPPATPPLPGNYLYVPFAGSDGTDIIGVSPFTVFNTPVISPAGIYSGGVNASITYTTNGTTLKKNGLGLTVSAWSRWHVLDPAVEVFSIFFVQSNEVGQATDFAYATWLGNNNTGGFVAGLAGLVNITGMVSNVWRYFTISIPPIGSSVAKCFVDGVYVNDIGLPSGVSLSDSLQLTVGDAHHAPLSWDVTQLIAESKYITANFTPPTAPAF